MNSRENRLWAWGLGSFTLVLVGVLAASREDDEGAAYLTGVAVGRIAASV